MRGLWSGPYPWSVPAYLDHAASTPVRPEAVDAMLPWLRDHPGNPSGAHPAARRARKAIDEARDVLAARLGAHPHEVVFTSGGTEADNLAVLGRHDAVGGLVVCGATEHHAVLDPVLARGGRTVPVDAAGVVDVTALADLLDEAGGAGEAVRLVSVMLANNEVGTVQPLAEVVEVVRDRAPDALVHTDAVQAFAWLDVAGLAAGVDLISVSAHKFGGPKGVGALVVRDGARLAPRAVGGGQEGGRRGGTPNVAGIVGMGVAAELAGAGRAEAAVRVAALRDRLLAGLVDAVPGVVETGVAPGTDPAPARAGRLPGIAHVCIPDVESEALLFLLERAGIDASAASSCSSGAMEPSHVLAAMGVPRDLAFGSLRLSLGHASTAGDVEAALAAVPPAVAQLRAHR